MGIEDRAREAAATAREIESTRVDAGHKNLEEDLPRRLAEWCHATKLPMARDIAVVGRNHHEGTNDAGEFWQILFTFTSEKLAFTGYSNSPSSFAVGLEGSHLTDIKTLADLGNALERQSKNRPKRFWQ